MKRVGISYQKTFIMCLVITLLCCGYLTSANVRTFKGTVKPFITTTLPYGYNDSYRGIVQWTALPGEILLGPIYDKNGKVVQEGDIIIKLDTEYRASVVKTKEDAIKIAESNLNWAKAQYARYKKLSEKKAVSLQDFQQIENNYLSAVATLDSAKADLITAQNLYDLTTYRAQFDAIVDDVLMPCGLLAGEPKTIQISQVNPIGIEIDMPRELAKTIKMSTPIKIYPTGSDTSVGVIANYYVYTKTGIRVFTLNSLLPPENKGNLPLVKTVRTVFRLKGFERSINKLILNKSCIKHDEKGDYVWHVKNSMDLQPGKGVDPVLELEKIYIKTGEYIYKVDNHWDCITLDEPAKLKLYSMVAEDVPENIKDGDKVYWYTRKLEFMPDDPVKVEIELK